LSGNWFKDREGAAAEKATRDNSKVAASIMDIGAATVF
jgi:hypothetical protein